ncbi:MAG TPA: cation:proton antiporter, partial [Chloroflexota bacterium]
AVALAATLLAAAETGRLMVGPAVGGFVYSVAAAVVIGSLAGLVLSVGTRLLDDELVETALSGVLAYGSYMAADSLGASGIIATAFAGLVFGTVGRRFGLSEQTRLFLDGFWRFAAFLANAVLFILIGLEIRLPVLQHQIQWVLPAIVVVVLARALMVYTLTLMMHRVSTADGHVMVWSGLRGGVAIAVALSLPATIPGHNLILALTFGVVLFTTLVQGLTIEPLARRLGLVTDQTTDVADAQA